MNEITVEYTDDICIVSGDTRFTVKKNCIDMEKSELSNKIQYISNFMDSHKDSCTTTTIMECSRGILVYLAVQKGIKVSGLDSRKEYIDITRDICKHFNWTAEIEKYDIDKIYGKSDIVIASSLLSIHADFDTLFNRLERMTKKYLLIEWVDPNCPTTNLVQEISTEIPYTKITFLINLRKYFCYVEKVFQISNVRELYLCTVAI